MIFAAIDIGSNAGRLLFSNITEINGAPKAEKASLIRIPLRLGFDVFKEGYISAEKENDLVNTLKAFKLLIDVYKPVSYKACATSAMRDARNSQEIIARIKNEVNLDLEVIDGIEEAKLITANNEAFCNDKIPYMMYVDVGGGSTEISLLHNNQLVDSQSFNVGTIRLLSNGVNNEEWDKMARWLNQYKELSRKLHLVGSGGNINKIKKLYGNESDGFVTFDKIAKAYRQLKKISVEERIISLNLRPDRADVIVPATEIFLFIEKVIKVEKVFIPRIGLTDGIVYSLYHELISKQSVIA
jgi:exopolyphosphatase/guanosine-5'-triphosphate,3'-diphosphate pyrophosphatase